jgi:hypothetical protein
LPPASRISARVRLYRCIAVPETTAGSWASKAGSACSEKVAGSEGRLAGEAEPATSDGDVVATREFDADAKGEAAGADGDAVVVESDDWALPPQPTIMIMTAAASPSGPFKRFTMCSFELRSANGRAVAPMTADLRIKGWP